MEDDVSEKPTPGMSYYQVLTGLPPAAPKPRQQEKKVEHETQNPTDDLPPSGFTPRNIERNRNTLPKARQKAGPPPEEVYASDNLSRTVSGENVNSKTYYSRGRGRGNYQNSRGSQKPYRGNSRDSSANNSNTLPRSQGGGSRGRGQYGSYGSLPRRGGRQEYGGGGDGPNRGNYESRGNGRGRGRGYYQGQSGYQEQSSSREHVSRAPSQRRIDSLQRKRKMQTDKTKSFHENEVPRACSLPRNPVKRSLPNLLTSSMTSSFSSSQNIWSPNGKCPSFADILKRATGSEEALEKSEKVEVAVTTITTTNLQDEGIPTMEEDTNPETSCTENLTISQQIYTSTRIPEGFGSVPCLTQEKQSDAENVSRPPRKADKDSKHISQISTTASSNSLSLFSDNDKVVVSEVAVLEPSISQTVQIQNTESEVIKIELTKETVNDNTRSSTDELSFVDKPNKSSSDDNISTSSQKTSRFGAIKSYANILSGGLRKVGSVFGRKPKEEQAHKKEKESADSKTESSDSSKSLKEYIEPKPVIVNQSPKTSSTEKPEIPGLLFKTDLERRPSKKKRRSRPSSTFDIEGRIESVENVHIDTKNIESVKQDEEIETKIESTFVEKKSVVLQEDYEEIRLTDNDKTNSMRRRNSKKKKKESTPSKKFNDEIDQALHEIKLMDREEKNKAEENTNSLKRRPSKKSKKSSDHTDEQSKDEFRKPLADSDTGNIADDEADKQKKKASVKLENPKPKPSFSVEKEKEKVPVRITSSFSCERLESLPEITGDATKSHTKLTLAERKQKSYSFNQDSSPYSFSIADEEEIECLKEDTVTKDIISKKTSMMSSTTSEIMNVKTSEIKIELTKDAKPAIAGLPMDDASDAWMIDDVGTMDSDSDDEVEQTKQTTIGEKVIETIAVTDEKVQEKPAIAGLPMDDASDAWMIDDVGTMDSDSEEEVEQTKNTVCEKVMETILVTEEKIKEKPNDIKPAIAGLPMDDASDAWMIDDVGTMDSDSGDEVEQTKQTTICEKFIETIAVTEEKIQDNPNDSKPAIAGLPMDDASEAWMIDDVGTMDSDSDDEVEQTKETNFCEKIMETIAVTEEKIQDEAKETKPAIAGLPMDDASDAWMIDDVGTMDSDSEEEVEQTKEATICEKFIETIAVTEEKIQDKTKDTKSAIDGLPMDDASDAWMIDDVGTMDSDSEDEVEQTKEATINEKFIETIAFTEEKIQDKTKDTKPAIAGLPMDDASDAWMIDDVGTMDSDSDDELEQTKETSICKKFIETVAVTEEKIQDKPKDTKPAIAGLPMDNASDAWMIDDVGTMDSDSEEEVINTKVKVITEKAEETFAIIEEIIQDNPTETKPAIAGLPMDDASDAWMNDDFGTMDSEEEDSIKSLEKEKKIIKEKIEEFEEKLSVKSVPSAFAGLPVNDVSDAWMNDDFIKIEDEEVPQDCYSPLCCATPGKDCYSSTCNRSTSYKSLSKDDSISDYDENDKETQMYAVPAEVEVGKVKEGRLSAIEEAKRFSCDDDEENQLSEVAEVVKDVHICDDDESTSWAFVASKEPSKLEETPNMTRNLSTSSNPALIVEIIEKVPKQDSMDPDGYKVIKGKTKTRDKRKSKEVPETSIEAILNQLDQPIETQRVSLQTDETSSTWTEDFEIVEKEDEDVSISNAHKDNPKEIKKIEEPDNSTKDSNANFVTDDPWLAVKKEYTRKESSTNKKTEGTEDAGYTIEVKVSTKETCLGKRLHEREETEWKMDVQCTQKNTMPDIIEGHDGNNFSISPNAKDSKTTSKTNESEKKFNSLPRLKTKAVSPERLCLSPSWMRKELSRTQSVESNLGSEGGIFGSVKDRKFSDSRTSCFTSSAETLDEHEDDVYWRLKNKVKKKKRRNQSGPSDVKSKENNALLFSSTKDLLEPLSAEPIIETKEESLITSNQSLISNSSINTIEEMESETIKTIVTSITKTSTAHSSMEQPNRKISTSQKGIPYEKLISMEMDALRKESVSPMQIDKESSISVALESVAESNMKSDFLESITIVKTSVTNDEMHFANTPQLEIKTDESRSVATPSIVLQNEEESKMVGATEIIRATSPMLNHTRPEFKRQNSKEMQQAVEVQRPLSFERQTTLSASLTTDNIADAWVNETDGSIDDDELDKKLDDKKKRSSWSSIAATVVSKVAKTKNESSTRKISKHETLIVQAEDHVNAEPIKNVDEDGFERCVGKKEMRQKRKSQNLDESNNQKGEINQPPCNDTKLAIAGLPMGDASDAWMDDDVGTIESDDEDDVEITKQPVINAKDVTQSQTKDMKPAIAGLPMDDASDEWMNDDVGTIESGSEDEVEQNQKNEKIVPETKKEQNTEQRKSYAGLPTDTVTDVWMNDDLESLDSEEEEEAKPLALTAPSWAGVASKTSVTGAVATELPQPPKIVSLKSSKSDTLILEADGEDKIPDDVEMDSEGFKEALSRKGKRERKLSKRISVSLEEVSKETHDIIDTDSVQYDLKAIEDAEIKYFESLEQKKSKTDTTDKIKSQHISSEKQPLALAAPSWAGIASKPPSSSLEDPDLPMAPQLVTLKHSTSQTLIIEANAKDIADEVEVDEEGFELATSRKVKRERKISKRISLSVDEETHEVEHSEVKTDNIGLPTNGNSLIMNLSMDSFWVCKHIFDDAEEKYFANKKVGTVPIKEINKYNKKDDEDRDENDDDEKDIKKEKNKRTKNSESNRTNEELETMEYNWTDESTYLSPNIPVLKPASLKISAPRDPLQIESHLSKNAIKLSNTIKKHIHSETGEHNIGSSSQHKDHDLKSSLKVDMENLQTAVANIEETLQQLTNEEIDGQLAVVKYTLKTLEELESEAISIEARLQKLPSGSDVDMMSLAATLTGNRTKLVTLHTQAEAQRARIERYMIERRKRVTEIKRYQSLLIDLEQWLGEAQATISTEIRLTSVKVVRDQIRASESLEQDLRTRSTQLEHLLKEVQQLVGYVDVQPLVNDMTSNLGSLHGVMEDAQQCLEHRLKNLQVRCT